MLPVSISIAWCFFMWHVVLMSHKKASSNASCCVGSRVVHVGFVLKKHRHFLKQKWESRCSEILRPSSCLIGEKKIRYKFSIQSTNQNKEKNMQCEKYLTILGISNEIVAWHDVSFHKHVVWRYGKNCSQSVRCARAGGLSLWWCGKLHVNPVGET